VHPFLDHPGPIAFAHRGGAGDAPENTMAAFGAAIALGYRYVETDVQLTADGVLVAFHDDRLDRVTGQAGLIHALPWSDVARARVGGREPIPRLAELLETWPDLRVNLDAKSDKVVAPLVRLLTDLDAFDRVCVGAFSYRRVARLRTAAGPRLCTALAPREVVALRAWAWGCRPVGRFVGRGGGNCVQVPLRHRGVPLVDRRAVAAAHRMGLPIHVWTVNGEAGMERLLDLGVDGLMTDRPAILRGVLERRGMWQPQRGAVAP
jgi:glycerophosphoryl diester phosphodiesterase